MRLDIGDADLNRAEASRLDLRLAVPILGGQAALRLGVLVDVPRTTKKTCRMKRLVRHFLVRPLRKILGYMSNPQWRVFEIETGRKSSNPAAHLIARAIFGAS